MTPINGLLKVIVYVENMDAQVRFYRDSLGLAVKSPNDATDFSNEFWVEFDTGATTLVLHGGGQKRIGVDAPKLAFAVDDINAARQTLIERGVGMGEIRSPAPGVSVCDGIDSEGNKFSMDCHT